MDYGFQRVAIGSYGVYGFQRVTTGSQLVSHHYPGNEGGGLVQEWIGFHRNHVDLSLKGVLPDEDLGKVTRGRSSSWSRLLGFCFLGNGFNGQINLDSPTDKRFNLVSRFFLSKDDEVLIPEWTGYLMCSYKGGSPILPDSIVDASRLAPEISCKEVSVGIQEVFSRHSTREYSLNGKAPICILQSRNQSRTVSLSARWDRRWSRISHLCGNITSGAFRICGHRYVIPGIETRNKVSFVFRKNRNNVEHKKMVSVTLFTHLFKQRINLLQEHKQHYCVERSELKKKRHVSTNDMGKAILYYGT